MLGREKGNKSQRGSRTFIALHDDPDARADAFVYQLCLGWSVPETTASGDGPGLWKEGRMEKGEEKKVEYRWGEDGPRGRS